ncbi:MAG: hypothetical protein SFT91_03590 [Rickettsiaceae bacterium]|nr:hypothetical protein [Rickettsiaceae bacterium]
MAITVIKINFVFLLYRALYIDSRDYPKGVSGFSIKANAGKTTKYSGNNIINPTIAYVRS